MICTVSGFDEGAVSYQHGRDSHFIAGGDSRRFIAFLLYEAITRQISRDAFWSVIVIVCALSLNLNYLWFSAAGRQQLPIENKPRVVVEEKAPVVHKANNAGKMNDAVRQHEKRLSAVCPDT